ncbi:MAG: Cobinamide kinase/cobinamide phosphate guanylyltransferase CobU [Thermoanaerobacterales bacterium 50_218]|nr:MAG: Cobinamide kinase/cobinamide phosphate guanylyltransferase CobU [Thermoanaerobacterales bacterium 50_218]HAA89897.1 bifunctional adenosylcobinamide kinase/adenosylcobinamide-phosphate guanylyltransferase [Peptococcaceae bacterium]
MEACYYNMVKGKFFFVIGGARSGKSTFAENLARSLGEPVTYIATARAGDAEMEERIKEHRKRRPVSWITVEEPVNVSNRIAEWGHKSKVIIVDCLTLLISNLLIEFATGGQEIDRQKKETILEEIARLAKVAKDSPAHVIVVSNEVGLGLVPPYPQGRLFRDLAGWANQLMAAEADKVYFLVAGIPLDLQSLQAKLTTVERSE